jgi:hypothetical protein
VKRFVAALALAAVLALPAAASAGGSFFIAELNNGLTVPMWEEPGVSPGYALGFTGGFGGKFKGNPLRFYLIGQLNVGSFTAERVHNGKLRLIDRQVTDYSAGVRIMLPIVKHLRVFGEFGLGIAQLDSSATSPELPGNIVIRDTTSDLAVFSAVGVQYRLLYHLSLGAKADFGWILGDESIDAVTAATSNEDPDHNLGRLNMYFTATAHF